MPLAELCELHHGGVAGTADDESGPAHEERLLIVADIRVYCSRCIKLLRPLLPGAAQQDSLLPWQALHLAEDDLFQSGPLRLGTGDDSQGVQILGNSHLLGAGENAGVVGPLEGGRNAGAAELAAQVPARAVWADIRYDHTGELAVKEAVEGHGHYLQRIEPSGQAVAELMGDEVAGYAIAVDSHAIVADDKIEALPCYNFIEAPLLQIYGPQQGGQARGKGGQKES